MFGVTQRLVGWLANRERAYVIKVQACSFPLYCMAVEGKRKREIPEESFKLKFGFSESFLFRCFLHVNLTLPTLINTDHPQEERSKAKKPTEVEASSQ